MGSKLVVLLVGVLSATIVSTVATGLDYKAAAPHADSSKRKRSTSPVPRADGDGGEGGESGEAEGKRVAIIGSGIGGGTTALELSKLRGIGSITVFETNNCVGGRLAAHEFAEERNKDTWEIGGTTLIAENKQFSSVMNEVGLKKENPKQFFRAFMDPKCQGEGVATDNGATRASRSDFGNYKAIFEETHHMMEFQCADAFLHPYVTEMNFEPFHSVDDFISRTHKTLSGNKFKKMKDCYTESTDALLDKLLAKRLRDNNQEFNDEVKTKWGAYKQEHVRPFINVNFNQDLEINGMAGAIGQMPTRDFSGFFKVETANCMVPAKAIQKSRADLCLNKKVTEIEKIDGGRLRLVVEDTDTRAKKCDGNPCTKFMENKASCSITNESALEFDIVVIAAPVRVKHDVHDDTKYLIDALPNEYQMQPVAATFVSASATETEFTNMRRLKGENDVPFNHQMCKGTHGDRVWLRYFGPRAPHSNSLRKFVNDPKLLDSFQWNAYPKLEPKRSFMEIEVLPGQIYFNNAVEWVFSCMEMMVVSAKNTARLIKAELGGTDTGGGDELEQAASPLTERKRKRTAPATDGDADEDNNPPLEMKNDAMFRPQHRRLERGQSAVPSHTTASEENKSTLSVANFI